MRNCLTLPNPMFSLWIVKKSLRLILFYPKNSNLMIKLLKSLNSGFNPKFQTLLMNNGLIVHKISS